MSTDKPEGEFKTIDEYIDSFPEKTRERLRSVRQVIKEEAPGSEETIKYRMPTFVLNGHNLVHFAGFKSHIGFYPTPSPMDPFREELSSYKMGKGSIQFQEDEPLPLALIRRMVQFRVREIQAKKARKK